jgi:SAM-dependent methyltransferase
MWRRLFRGKTVLRTGKGARLPHKPSQKLLRSITKKYGTNTEYTVHFMDHMLSNYRGCPQFDLYVESELGSLNRSREFNKSLCRELKNRDLFRGKECLDIGSSQGNSLIAFAESGAAKAAGIEISEDRYQTALININGSPNEIRTKIQMFRQDIQDEKAAGIGQFDIIFCIDVLEHVQDPRQAVKQICRLLKDTSDAFAYVKLRNFQHPQNVMHEPHYDLPSAVLLPHELAKQFYNLCRKSDLLEYEVFHWMSFYDYQAMFQSFGKRCTFFGARDPEPSCIDHIQNESRKILPVFDEFCEKHDLAHEFKKEIHTFIDQYLTTIRNLVLEYNVTKNRSLLERFYLNYEVFDIVMLVTNENSNSP